MQQTGREAWPGLWFSTLVFHTKSSLRRLLLLDSYRDELARKEEKRTVRVSDLAGAGVIDASILCVTDAPALGFSQRCVSGDLRPAWGMCSLADHL